MKHFRPNNWVLGALAALWAFVGTAAGCETSACPAAKAGAAGAAPRPATKPAANPTDRPPVYQQKQPHPDGIGKVYLGREIAKVMGHLGAGWLDRPEREREEQPRKAIEMMELKPTDV